MCASRLARITDHDAYVAAPAADACARAWRFARRARVRARLSEQHRCALSDAWWQHRGASAWRMLGFATRIAHLLSLYAATPRAARRACVTRASKINNNEKANE